MGQVVGHLADAQLVFLGRILFIARGQGAALPEALVKSLPAGALSKEGEANGILITPSEILTYLIAHEKHHLRVIRERYGIEKVV